MTDERYTIREKLLREAIEYTTKQRNKSYGEPDEDFQRIAAIASAMGFRFVSGDTGVNLEGHHVALFMVALKASRLAWMPTHQDSWTDMAGYAACGFETAKLQEARHEEAKPVPAEPDLMVDMERVGPHLTETIIRLGNEAVRGDCSGLETDGKILVGSQLPPPVTGNCVSCKDDYHSFMRSCIWRIRYRRNAP